MLDTALNWDKEPKKAPEFLAILDDISADGSFLVFEFLKRYLPKFGVTLVTLSRPSTHYAQVSRKVVSFL